MDRRMPAIHLLYQQCPSVLALEAGRGKGAVSLSPDLLVLPNESTFDVGV